MLAQPDPLWPVKLYIEKGGNIGYLSARSNVSVAIIRKWMRDGVPDRVINWNNINVPTQVKQFRDLYRAATVLMDRHFGG